MRNAGPILVAGRNGQVARALAALAERVGLPLVTIGRPELDLADPASVERAITATSPRAIINAAAYTLVDKAESEPDVAFRINRDGADFLAQGAERLDAPFIHLSTDYVFDGKKAAPYLEEDRPSPLGIYGRSKLEGEIAVLNACPAALVVRTSWVFSPYGQNFLKTMLRLADTRDHVRVVDDQYGAPTSAADIAQALLAMLEQIEAEHEDRGGIFHLTSAGETTWYGFAAAIFETWKKRGRRIPKLEPIKTADYPTPACRPADSRLNCSKVERIFGIHLHSWQEATETCLDELVAANADAH